MNRFPMKIKMFQNLGPLAGGLCAGAAFLIWGLSPSIWPPWGCCSTSPQAACFCRRCFASTNPWPRLQMDIADDVEQVTTDQRHLEVDMMSGRIEDGVHFVQKPFSRQELAVKVAEALGQLEGG